MTPSHDPHRRPARTEYFEYYDTYIRKVPDGDLLELARAQIGELRDFFGGVTEQQAMTLHAPYTWTVKQVLGHLIDCERIFGNRMHRFGFGDLQPLAGMNQDEYVANNDYVTPALGSLVEELLCCRQANLLLMQRIRPGAWDNQGVASDHPITVRALAWILVGHILHHMEIVRKRLAIPAA